MKKLSLSTKVLIGLIAGVLLGLFFGEKVAWFSVLGDVFIGLLQMTVLPYIMFSLIVNIGRLSMDTARKIIKYGLMFLSMLLLIGIISLLLLPLAFPHWENGSFYSSDFIREQVPFDLVKLYIPANPFESLSDNVVPAVVLFSIFVGLGMMKLPNKEILLKPLDVLTNGLNQVNKMVVKITPLGVFSIGAGVVSKLSWTDLSRLQGYLLLYLLAVLLLTFLVLPYIISSFTPYSSRTIFKITRSTLITIFATGKIIVVFPQLIEDIKAIIRTEEGATEEAQDEVDIIMPLAYPFPNLGTFMIFIFVPFAAWYTGGALSWESAPIFVSSTLLSSFVAPISGLPFVMDLLDIPQKTFQLFVMSTVITDRIRVVLGAFHLITLTLLTIAAGHGLLKLKTGKLIQGLIIVFIAGSASIYGMNKLLEKSMENIPTNAEIVSHFKIISPQQPFKVLPPGSKTSSPKWHGENTLSRIKRKGKIRVGFYEDAMPFTFFNTEGLLVGYGIDLAHQLATDLRVSIEFIPIKHGKLIENMKHDYYDIVMSDIFISSFYAQEMELSKPYLSVSLALLVKNDIDDFNNFKSTIALDTFTISYFERKEIAEEFLSFFPNGNGYMITDFDQFFNPGENDSIKIDAHLSSAERAAAVTIFHPDYKVVNPIPYHINNALVFPIAQDDVWRRYIDNWIEYRKKDGTFDKIYNQWILGHEFHNKKKPWSFYEDVIKAKWLSDSDSTEVEK